jgi:hypothetical protein
MKSLPITHKALNSPAKVSMEFLVENDSQTHKQFQDIGGDYAKGRKEGLKMTEKKGPQRKEPEPAKTSPQDAKAKAEAEAAAAKASGTTEIKAAPAP